MKIKVICRVLEVVMLIVGLFCLVIDKPYYAICALLLVTIFILYDMRDFLEK